MKNKNKSGLGYLQVDKITVDTVDEYVTHCVSQFKEQMKNQGFSNKAILKKLDSVKAMAIHHYYETLKKHNPLLSLVDEIVIFK